MQGVNKIGDKAGESKCALVFGQMNEPPGARARVALTGLTIAEYFRDFEGQDVLLFVDNIFRFTQVGSISQPFSFSWRNWEVFEHTSISWAFAHCCTICGS